MNRNSYETAYKKFDRWRGERSIGVRSVRTYLTQLKRKQSQRVVHSNMCELAATLPQKHPEQNWAWLKVEARDYAKEIGLTHGRRGFSPEPYDSGLKVSLPIENWPQEVQIKWHVLKDISVQKKKQAGAMGVLQRSRSARSKQVAIKPVTDKVRKMYKTALARYFFYLSKQFLADDWFPDAQKARGFANWIKASDVTAGIYLDSLYRALTCLFPDRIQDLVALKEDAQAVKSSAEPSRDKTEYLLNPAELFVKARTDFYETLAKPRTLRNLTRARNTVMVCLLCIHPLRMKNFVQLTEQDVEASRREFQKPEMKGKSPHAILIPSFLSEILKIYIKQIKPYFGDHDYLWMGNHGEPFKGKGASRAIKKYMELLTGIAMSGHRFRDAFATYYSEQVEEPDQTRMVSRELGHKSESMTDRHYRNNAKMICDSMNLQRDIETFLWVAK
jgi:integrase